MLSGKLRTFLGKGESVDHK